MPGYTLDVEQMKNEATQEGTNGSAGTAQLVQRKSIDSSDWNLLAQAIDRVLFIAYIIIILIYMMVYIGGASVAASTTNRW